LCVNLPKAALCPPSVNAIDFFDEVERRIDLSSNSNNSVNNLRVTQR
jgi:hypothetical protein